MLSKSISFQNFKTTIQSKSIKKNLKNILEKKK